MKIKVYFPVFCCLIISLLALMVWARLAPDIELVESVPIETGLDNPEVRDTAQVWLEMIERAQKKLDIEEFYFIDAPGEPLEQIINAILAAADRGVEVRIISAKEFYEVYPRTLDRLKKRENISVRLLDLGKITGGIMHAKYFIVDDKEVFLGSQNFDWRSLKHIHEIGVRIYSREFAGILADLFALDWQLASPGNTRTFEEVVARRDYSVPVKIKGPRHTAEIYPVYSPRNLLPDEKLWDEDHLAGLIGSARQDVLIHLLTYSPVAPRSPEFYPVLDNALRLAASRGVQVKLIVSDWSKLSPRIEHLKSLSLVPNIEVKLSTIPQWSGGFIPFARVEHCKYLIVDEDACWIGSSNWEKDYFYKSRNVGVIIKDKQINNTLRKIFTGVWKGPYAYELKPEVKYTPPKIDNEKETQL